MCPWTACSAGQGRNRQDSVHGDGWVNVTPEAAGKSEASEQQSCHLGVDRQEQVLSLTVTRQVAPATSSGFEISFFHESLLNHSPDFSDPYLHNHF